MILLSIALLPAVALLGRAPALDRAENLLIASCLTHLETEKAFYARQFAPAETTYQFMGSWVVKRESGPGPLADARVCVERLGKQVVGSSFLLYVGADTAAIAACDSTRGDDDDAKPQ